MISELLNEAIAASRVEYDNPPEFFHPSSLGVCDRKTLFKRNGIKGKPLDDRTIRKFWMGNQVEDQMVRLIVGRAQDKGVRVIAPTPLTGWKQAKVRDEEYGVSGKIDLLFAINDKPFPVEVKSVHSRALDKKDLPHPHYKVQLANYLTFPIRCPVCRGDGAVVRGSDEMTYEEPCSEPLCSGGLLHLPDEGLLFYWSKDDARTKEFPLKATDELRDWIKTYLKRLGGYQTEYKDSGKLPPVLPLVQALTKSQTGEMVPFVYQRAGPWGPAGTQKMEHDKRCAMYSGCEYLGLDHGCPLKEWGL